MAGGWGRSCDDWRACGWIWRRAGCRRGHIGWGGAGGWSHDYGWGGHRGQSDRRRGRRSCAFDFVDWNLIFARAAADDFGADIVQHVWVVLNGLCALVGGRAWMSKALSKSSHLWSAARQTRCHEGDEDCCAAIGEAWHGGRCPLTSDFSGAEKSAGEYSGRRPNRPSGIGAGKSGQIHVEKDGVILRRDFYFASGCGDENGAAALQIAVSVVRVD